MTDLWTTLVPLVTGSAVVPIQIIITILLLRSTKGRVTAVAWVAGMTAVRLVQGVLFGLVLTSDSTPAGGEEGTSPLTGGLLLVIGILLLVVALRQVLNQPDADDPPPKWLEATRTMAPARAFLLGAAILAIGAKFWVLTLGAISAINDADLGYTAGIALFLLFVLLAESAQLGVLGVAFAMPERSAAVLTRASGWLEAHNRVIVIVLGVIFGVWFLIKGLTNLGVL